MTTYQKWEDFLANELKEISREQTLYDRAGDLLSSTFQTGEHWVQVNLELVAVYGSIYGILISFSLCSLVVAVLSHNWRIVLSMFLTIMSILFSLLGLFSMFGWKLGIVEAVSLSILVGNALDYCIHLSEGYMAVDNRHLAFVDRFKVNISKFLHLQYKAMVLRFLYVCLLISFSLAIYCHVIYPRTCTPLISCLQIIGLNYDTKCVIENPLPFLPVGIVSTL